MGRQINQLLQREMVDLCGRKKTEDWLCILKQDSDTSLRSHKSSWVQCIVGQSVPISPQPLSLEGDQLVSDSSEAGAAAPARVTWGPLKQELWHGAQRQPQDLYRHGAVPLHGTCLFVLRVL